jgi:hypothetical protein
MRHIFLLIGLLTLCAGALPAQEPYVPKYDLQGPEGKPIPFWESSRGLRVAAAAKMIVTRDPLMVAAIRLAASDQAILWPEWQFIADSALPLSEDLLKKIKDDTSVPDFSGKAPNRPDDFALYFLQSQALVLANDTPAENFKKSAEENRFVQFTQLFNEPSRWRGKVVSVHGPLLVLRQFDAPRPAQAQGLKVIYEGWIKGPTKGANPYCVQFTELPAGLEPFEPGQREPEVTFHGYFLRRFKYLAGNGELRRAPLLIGRTLERAPTPAPAVEEAPFSRFVLFVVAGGVLLLIIVAFLFGWWFRRGDARIQSRISRLREQHGLEFQDIPLARPVNPPEEHQGDGSAPARDTFSPGS